MTINRLALLKLDYVPADTPKPKNNIRLSGLSLTASTLKPDYQSVSSKLLKNTQPNIDPYSVFNDKKITPNKPLKQTASSTFDQIRKGNDILERGDKGEAVKQLQQKLTSLGFPVQAVGEFGPQTEATLKKFQKRYGITPTGKLGPTTMKALDGVMKPLSTAMPTNAVIGKAPTRSALKLANTARSVAVRKNTYGWCYSGVATSVSKVFGNILYGESAYQAAGILAKNSKFQEIKVKPNQLPDLQAGSIVVWGKTKASPHGHISVALGNGKEASDHVTNQLTSLRGAQNFRVFLPVA